jgi:hypothetical protein
LLAELYAALGFSLSTTVGDKDVWHYDTVFILTIEHFHGFNSFWNRSTTSDEDTVNIKSESILVRD